MDVTLKPCSTTRVLRRLRNVDRISGLPDELLIRILSLLPTQDAVATSVLSKRWSHLFTWITSLEFDDSPISHCVESCYLIERFSNFTSFVDTVLEASKSKNISRFGLKIGVADLNFDRMHQCTNDCFPEMNAIQLNSWISFPITRGVRELDLDIRVENPGKVPRALFTCETLEVLTLNLNLDLNHPVPMSFRLPNLKVFRLLSVLFPVNLFLTGLVSNCPLLEELSVSYSCRQEHGNVINISSPSLRKLSLFFNGGEDEGVTCEELVLDTPNLQYFKYSDNCLPLRCSVRNLNAVAKASISIYYWCGADKEVAFSSMLSLLRALSNVQHLSLDDTCIETFQVGDRKDQLPVFRKLTNLRLGCGIITEWHKVLLQFLYCSPFLETLTFYQGLGHFEGSKERVELESHRWRSTQAIPSCVVSHIKRIVINSYHGGERELNLMKFLLANAHVLEELVIHTTPLSSDWSTIPIKKKDWRSIKNMLEKLPRASIKCRILVHLELFHFHHYTPVWYNHF